MQTNLTYIIDRFLQYSEVIKNNSHNTVDVYKYYLNKFYHWIGEDKPIQQITLDNIHDYRIHLNRHKTAAGKLLSLKSQREYIVAIRSLLRYCSRNDIPALSVEKIDLPKFPERIVTFLTHEEVIKMFDVITGKDIISLRNRAILETLYSTGLRISEFLSLDRNQVDLKEREFSVIGKGNKARLVFLSIRAAKAIQAYLDARIDNYKPLIIDHSTNNSARSTGCRLTKWSAAKMVRESAKKAGITKKVSCHTFRHSFATDLLSNGADMRSVQELLGHASIKTTQIYTHVTNFQLKKVFSKFHNKKKYAY